MRSVTLIVMIILIIFIIIKQIILKMKMSQVECMERPYSQSASAPGCSSHCCYTFSSFNTLINENHQQSCKAPCIQYTPCSGRLLILLLLHLFPPASMQVHHSILHYNPSPFILAFSTPQWMTPHTLLHLFQTP